MKYFLSVLISVFAYKATANSQPVIDCGSGSHSLQIFVDLAGDVYVKSTEHGSLRDVVNADYDPILSGTQTLETNLKLANSKATVNGGRIDVQVNDALSSKITFEISTKNSRPVVSASASNEKLQKALNWALKLGNDGRREFYECQSYR